MAKTLQARSLGTVLLDLLTRDEEQVDVWTTECRFDIKRLATRVVTSP